jgi:glutaminase
MTIAGLYETPGDWLYDIGLPGKSGIGGGIATVAPGRAGWARSRRSSTGMATESRGNSLRSAFLSRQLDLSLFASDPEG